MVKITTLITKGRRAPLGSRRRKLIATNIESDSDGRIWACVGNKCRLIRTRRGFVHPKKGQKSWTMKGRKDFTTKKGNKFFNRRSRRQRRAQGSKIKRRPYRGGCYGRSGLAGAPVSAQSGGVLTRRVPGNFVEVDGRRRAEVVSTRPQTGNVDVIYLDARSGVENNVHPSRVRWISTEELDEDNKNRRDTRRATLTQQLNQLKAQEALDEAVRVSVL